MRVKIDWELCIGSGLCVAASSGAFRLVGDAGESRAILDDPDVSDEAVWAAARACPMLAIRLFDDGEKMRIFPSL